ncbi:MULTISPECIES: hypothetical protein [Flavobacterium]|uniref:Uncharacterized protein n=1 Tax=Flavobacterium jumunjinense TaxID=998845 RepID=A0ABV5GVM0_9FLAO|nr:MULTISPECIES: hypothetical protein [Flavobacterium]
MKTILKINKGVFYATLALMLTFYGGPVGLIVLGFVQIVSAFFLTAHLYTQSNKAKKYLTIYWILVIIETLILFLTFKYRFAVIDFETSCVIILVTPLIVATYFFIILTKLIKEYENINKPYASL